MNNLLLIIWLLICPQENTNNLTYSKSYYNNGVVKEEGWLDANKKIAYWVFRYENGRTKEQGHYKEDKKSKYWYYYSINGNKLKEGHFLKGQKKWLVVFLQFSWENCFKN